MTIYGAIIKTDEIIGITNLNTYMREHPSEFQLSFAIITRSSQVEFKSILVQDFHISTKREQAELQEFRDEYQHMRKRVSYLLDDGHEEFRLHKSQVYEAFNIIAEHHRLLEDELTACKAKGRGEWISLLNGMRQHIIALKNLAE